MDVQATAVEGTWWRQGPANADVHYWPDNPMDGRWQRGQVVDALYLADSPETAWAEWYRYLAEADISPAHSLPRDLWRWRVSLGQVADLSDEARLRQVGLQPPRPERSEWPGFQAVGERLWTDGWPALVAPSAARPESGLVLCLFRTAREVAGAVPEPPPETFDEPPTVPRGLTT